jgi:hypothetical protein
MRLKTNTCKLLFYFLTCVSHRNGESAQNRKLSWSPDVSLDAFDEVLSELFMWNVTQPVHRNGAGIFKGENHGNPCNGECGVC